MKVMNKKTVRANICAIVFLFLSVVGGIATFLMSSSSALAYQSPGKPTGLVNDFAQIFSASERDALAAKLVDFGRTTGNAFVIVTVSDLGGDSVDNFAEKLFAEWGIGSEKDNGILLLISHDDKKVRIEVGYGLEPVITDAISGSIIRNTLAPAFKDGRYFDGVNGAADTIIGVISGNPEYVNTVNAGASSDSRGSRGFGDLVYVVIFAALWIVSILGRSKSWWLGGVLGGVAGVIISIIFGFIYIGVISIVGLAVIGLIFDLIVSTLYAKHSSGGTRPPWWLGGGGFGGGGHSGSGGFGGGFGGFGGGRSGGGGASGSW
jgi:uncharacterized protein